MGKIRSILGRLALVAIAAAVAVVSYQFVQTLAELDRIEAERDAWQRPDDVIRALSLKEGDRVVDFGSGAGYFTLRLAPVVGPSGRVFAVDIRRLSLTFLRVRAARRGEHQIEVILADERDARLPPGPVDAVLMVNTYHELRDQSHVLRQLYQPLERGGRLVVADRRHRSTVAGARDQEPAHPGHEMSPAAAEVVIRAAGFEIVSRDETFIDRHGDDSWWLLVCRKP